ncbi:hypothetical protein EON80_31305 [bacterium]|nr:MAG: hypothetical protein EON80_31305 [bacterium]
MKPTSASLTLITLHDFSAHAHEIGAQRVYLSVSSNSTDMVLVPSESPSSVGTHAGRFVVVATARTPETVLQCVKTVGGVNTLDAWAQPAQTEALVTERLNEIAAELVAAGLIVKRGRWSIQPLFDGMDQLAQI